MINTNSRYRLECPNCKVIIYARYSEEQAKRMVCPLCKCGDIKMEKQNE